MARTRKNAQKAATRRAAISFLVFAVVALSSLVVLYNTMVAHVSGDTHAFTAEFSDVNGLRTGDDVRLAGVKVGDVTDISVDGDHARVEFTTLADTPVRTDTGLVLRYQNLIGQRYLSLLPGPAAGRMLADGATIPLAETSPGFDLTALLNGFRPLFQVLQPDDVNQLSESIIKVLQGEGGTVHGLLQQTTSLTNYLADQDALFHETAANLTPVLKEVSGDGVALADTVHRLGQLTQALADDRRTLGRSIDGLAGLLGTTDDVLARARDPLQRDIDGLTTVADLYARHSDAYAKATPALAALLSALGRTTSYRSAINTYMCTVTVAAGGQEVPLEPAGGKTSQVCR